MIASNTAVLRARSSRNRRGSSAVEYALILALIAGGLFAVWNLFGASVRGSFARLNHESLATGSAGHVAGTSKAVPGGQIGEADVAHGSYRVWAMPLLVTAIALGSAGYTMVVRRRVKLHGSRHEGLPALSEEVPHNRLFDKRQRILKLIEHDLYALFEGRLTVRHLMSSDLITVRETCPVAEIKELMIKNVMRHMLVCDAHGALLGVISDRDVPRGTGKLARDIMCANPLSTTADTLISPAVTLMVDRHISSLPVMEGGKLVGVLTTTDLVLAMQCSLQVMLKVGAGGAPRAEEHLVG